MVQVTSQAAAVVAVVSFKFNLCQILFIIHILIRRQVFKRRPVQAEARQLQKQRQEVQAEQRQEAQAEALQQVSTRLTILVLQRIIILILTQAEAPKHRER